MPPKPKKDANPKKEKESEKNGNNAPSQKEERKEFMAANPLGDIPGTLLIKCRKLRDKDTLYAGDKSDAKVILFQRSSLAGKWSKVGETEIIRDNLNPEFKKKFSFNMDGRTELKFECWDEDETRNGPKFELIGAATVVLKELIEKINTEVPLVLRLEKSPSFNGEVLVTLKTNEDIGCLEARAQMLAEEGFDVKKDAEMKRKVTERMYQYVEESCLPMAFKVILAEIVAKKIPAEEVYIYGAKRLRELGEQINKIVKLFNENTEEKEEKLG